MRVAKRRRIENKTDYKARLRLLKSGKPRIVFRKTNRYIIGQYVVSEEARDRVIVGVNSKELLKFGWKGKSLKNLGASYLTGLLLGQKIIESGNQKKAVLDIGLIRSIKGSRVYGFVKGVVEAGVEIKVKKEMFPDEKRIKEKVEKLEEIKEKILRRKNGSKK